MTRPEVQVESLLADLKAKLDLGDVQRVYMTGDSAVLLSMEITKTDRGYSVRGKDSVVDDVLHLLGLTEAKVSVLPEATDERELQDDLLPLDVSEHSTYRTCVRKILHLAHQRADKQSGWRLTSGGLLLYHGCLVLSWARRQACYAQSSAESELYSIGTGAVEALGLTQLLAEWHEPCTPILYSDSSSALAVVRRRGPGRMKHVELKMLAIQQWHIEGRLRIRKIGTDDNASDMLTKAMSQVKLRKFGYETGLRGGVFAKET